VKNFELQLPTRIVFGQGVLQGLGAAVRGYGSRALLVYGRASIKESGLFDTVAASLRAAGVGVIEYGGVQPNPVLSHAEEGVRRGKAEGADVVLAVGGGSVIDESKAIALGCRHTEPLWDFYTHRAVVKDALPLVVVQTLPATSSETNAASVLTNAAARQKYSVRSPFLYPKVSFLDPDLTRTIPLQYTAYACTDILAHMMEGYFTATAAWMPVQDGLAEGLCRAVMEGMERLLVDPTEYESRAAIMWAGALAWSGLVNAGAEGASIPNHMLEHPLSAYYDLAHGAGLSVVIPAWLKYKKKEIGTRILRFGTRIMGLEARLEAVPEHERPDLVIAALEAWYRKIGTPVSFAEAGLEHPDLSALADHAMALADLWGVVGYTKEDALAVYRLC